MTACVCSPAGSRKGAEFARVEDTPVPDLNAFVRELEESGVPVFISDEVLNQNYRKHWTEMSHDDLMGLRDTIKSLEHAGKFRKKLLTSLRNRDLEQVVAEIVRNIKEYYKVSGEPVMTPGPDGCPVRLTMQSNYGRFSPILI
ncbi:MAG: hypothetical protein LBG12_11240 [Synergistaceae bacterium]|nr:hypothetical protein [Synergistaceae bacterium]